MPSTRQIGRRLLLVCVCVLLVSVAAVVQCDGNVATNSQGTANDSPFDVMESSQLCSDPANVDNPSCAAAQANVASQANVNPLQVDPEVLSFGERSLCIPAVVSVNFTNILDEDLHVFSITVVSVHFHSSFFKYTVTPPGANTTLSVVFLPRALGPVESHLVIQTSVGVIKHRITGVGVPNPYRVQPLVAVRLPVGVHYAPDITIYNPSDSETLTVNEVYTSGGFLHLNLPEEKHTESSQARLKQTWTIAPLQQSTLVHLSFISQTAGRYQGFVNVKTSADDLIIPVDVQTIKGGIHRIPEELDFGTLTRTTENVTLNVSLLNSGPTPLQVLEVSHQEPRLHMVSHRPVLKPGEMVEVATLTFLANHKGLAEGTVLVRTNDTNPNNAHIRVPYRGRVLHGSLSFRKEQTNFLALGDKAVRQRLQVKNEFEEPVMVYSAEVNDGLFSVGDFVPGSIVPPGTTWSALSILFKPNGTQGVHAALLTLNTNASVVRIPLHSYHGMLQVAIPDTGAIGIAAHSGEEGENAGVSGTGDGAGKSAADQGEGVSNEVDFGVLGVNEMRSRTFNLTNDNPVGIAVQRVTSECPSELAIRIGSIWDEEGRMQPIQVAAHELEGGSAREPSLVLGAGYTAVVSLDLKIGSETTGRCLCRFETAHESIEVAVLYHSMQGTLTLTPASVDFGMSFPGKLMRREIVAKSTYNRALTVVSITSSDVRILPQLRTRTLQPNVTVVIGHVTFDPSKVSYEDNYMAESSIGAQAGLSKPGEPLTKRDVLALKRREAIWEGLQRSEATQIGATITLHTDVVMGYTINVRASLSKPTLVKESIVFPLSPVGTTISKSVRVFNPSDKPVHVQLLPLPSNQSSQSSSGAGQGAVGMRGGHGGFSSYGSGSVGAGGVAGAAFVLGRTPAGGMLVQPGAEEEVGIVNFSPSSTEVVSTTLYVKNNLTILQAVKVSGRGGVGNFLFTDGGGSVLKYLKFEMRRVHLKACRRGTSEGGKEAKSENEDAKSGENEEAKSGEGGSVGGEESGPAIAFTRVFTAVNTGNLPITITGMGVNGAGCHAYGFQVHQCKGFQLQPEQVVDVAITFRPDFSASVVQRELHVSTSQGVMSFPMMASLPHDMLDKCAELTQTSPLEQKIRLVSSGVLLVVFLALTNVLLKEIKSDGGASSNEAEVALAAGKTAKLASSNKGGKSNGGDGARENKEGDQLSKDGEKKGSGDKEAMEKERKAGKKEVRQQERVEDLRSKKGMVTIKKEENEMPAVNLTTITPLKVEPMEKEVSGDSGVEVGSKEDVRAAVAAAAAAAAAAEEEKREAQEKEAQERREKEKAAAAAAAAAEQANRLPEPVSKNEKGSGGRSSGGGGSGRGGNSRRNASPTKGGRRERGNGNNSKSGEPLPEIPNMAPSGLSRGGRNGNNGRNSTNSNGSGGERGGERGGTRKRGKRGTSTDDLSVPSRSGTRGHKDRGGHSRKRSNSDLGKVKMDEVRSQGGRWLGEGEGGSNASGGGRRGGAKRSSGQRGGGQSSGGEESDMVQQVLHEPAMHATPGRRHSPPMVDREEGSGSLDGFMARPKRIGSIGETLSRTTTGADVGRGETSSGGSLDTVGLSMFGTMGGTSGGLGGGSTSGGGINVMNQLWSESSLFSADLFRSSQASDAVGGSAVGAVGGSGVASSTTVTTGNGNGNELAVTGGGGGGLFGGSGATGSLFGSHTRSSAATGSFEGGSFVPVSSGDGGDGGGSGSSSGGGTGASDGLFANSLFGGQGGGGSLFATGATRTSGDGNGNGSGSGENGDGEGQPAWW